MMPNWTQAEREERLAKAERYHSCDVDATNAIISGEFGEGAQRMMREKTGMEVLRYVMGLELRNGMYRFKRAPRQR